MAKALIGLLGLKRQNLYTR